MEKKCLPSADITTSQLLNTKRRRDRDKDFKNYVVPLKSIFAICNILPKCEFVWRGHLLMIGFLTRYLPYWSLEALSWGHVGVTPKTVSQLDQKQ